MLTDYEQDHHTGMDIQEIAGLWCRLQTVYLKQDFIMNFWQKNQGPAYRG